MCYNKIVLVTNTFHLLQIGGSNMKITIETNERTFTECFEEFLRKWNELSKEEKNDVSLPKEKRAEETPQRSEEEQVIQILKACGIPLNLNGYTYIKAAVLHLLESKNPTAVSTTKEIYPYVAKKYSTTPTLVERGIRHAIEVTWSRKNTSDMIETLFRNTIDPAKAKPTNSEFIYTVVEYYMHGV